MVVSMFTKLGLFLGRGQDGDCPWAPPRVPKATGRDNGLQHLALHPPPPPTPPHEYVLCFLEWGAACVSASATTGTAPPRTPAGRDPTLRLTGKSSRALRSGAGVSSRAFAAPSARCRVRPTHVLSQSPGSANAEVCLFRAWHGGHPSSPQPPTASWCSAGLGWRPVGEGTRGRCRWSP